MLTYTTDRTELAPPTSLKKKCMVCLFSLKERVLRKEM